MSTVVGTLTFAEGLFSPLKKIAIFIMVVFCFCFSYFWSFKTTPKKRWVKKELA